MGFGLEEHTIATIHSIFLQYPQIERAIIYGSRAKGTYHKGSDIDMTLVGQHLSYNDLLHIMGDLDESPIPYTVDLSIFDYIEDHAVRDHIKRRGQIFYERSS